MRVLVLVLIQPPFGMGLQARTRFVKEVKMTRGTGMTRPARVHPYTVQIQIPCASFWVLR